MKYKMLLLSWLLLIVLSRVNNPIQAQNNEILSVTKVEVIDLVSSGYLGLSHHGDYLLDWGGDAVYVVDIVENKTIGVLKGIARGFSIEGDLVAVTASNSELCAVHEHPNLLQIYNIHTRELDTICVPFVHLDYWSPFNNEYVTDGQWLMDLETKSFNPLPPVDDDYFSTLFQSPNRDLSDLVGYNGYIWSRETEMPVAYLSLRVVSEPCVELGCARNNPITDMYFEVCQLPSPSNRCESLADIFEAENPIAVIAQRFVPNHDYIIWAGYLTDDIANISSGGRFVSWKNRIDTVFYINGLGNEGDARILAFF